jgi:rhodanese-related sulfurtransferase
MTKEEFIKQVCAGIAPPPQYFPKNAAINKTGYDSYKEVLEHGTHPLSVEQTIEELNEGALLLDTRDPNEFCKGFIPGSLNIGLGGTFAVWVGTLVPDITRPIILVVEEQRAQEAVTRLARVGYDNTIGYIKNGVQAWKDSGRQLETIENITPQEFAERIPQKIEVLDVRKPSEFETQHVSGVENFPLDYINEHFQELDKNKKYYLYCRSGYRSMIASSILKSIGVKEVVNVREGMQGILQTKLPLTTYHSPATVES